MKYILTVRSKETFSELKLTADDQNELLEILAIMTKNGYEVLVAGDASDDKGAPEPANRIGEKSPNEFDDDKGNRTSAEALAV